MLETRRGPTASSHHPPGRHDQLQVLCAAGHGPAKRPRWRWTSRTTAEPGPRSSAAAQMPSGGW